MPTKLDTILQLPLYYTKKQVENDKLVVERDPPWTTELTLFIWFHLCRLI